MIYFDKFVMPNNLLTVEEDKTGEGAVLLGRRRHSVTRHPPTKLTKRRQTKTNIKQLFRRIVTQLWQWTPIVLNRFSTSKGQE